MARVLGRVTGAIDVPRGPDVLHRIHVPAEWLADGATIELELPRNLSCAACDGGGCGVCERSGAISLRGRKDPVESVRVTLPRRPPAEEPPSSGKRGLVVRIPGRGGAPPATDAGLPRGILRLSVFEADEPDAGIHRVEAFVEGPEVAAPPAAPLPVAPPRATPRRRLQRPVLIGIILLILWISFLVWLRLTGRM